MNWVCEFCGAKEPKIQLGMVDIFPDGWVEYEIADEYCPCCDNVEKEGRILEFCCEEHKQEWLTEND